MEGMRSLPRALPPMPSMNQDNIPISRPRKKKLNSNTILEDVAQDLVISPSDSKEPLSPEKRKKKKKKVPLDAETSFSQRSLPSSSVVQNGNEGDYQPSEEAITRKPRKRAKKLRSADQGFPNELGVEEEDVISDGQMKSPEPHPMFIIPSSNSQPVAKLFVEKNRRFQAADRSRLAKTAEQVDVFLDVKPTWTSMDVSLSVHRGFRVLGLFSSGFLAGYSVWNIVVVYVLAGPQLSTLPNLLQVYQVLANPSQCFLYFLLVLSTVSAFDRIDLARATDAFRGLLVLDPSAVASFLYFVALFLALSQQMTSDRINFYTLPSENGSIWQVSTERQILQPWIVVNLVVALLVGLAWLILSCHPDLDHSEESLFVPEDEDYPDLDQGTKVQA